MVNDVIHSPGLRGAQLMLHDIDPARLERAYRLASRLNSAQGSPVRLDWSLDPAEAMTGSDFALISAEVHRWEYWKQDFEVPKRHGATHITGENGGPGAVFHSLRSIRTTLGICADLARYCPGVFLVNLTNPMSRVSLAISRATELRFVGMCHEFGAGVARLARMLRLPKDKIQAKASGINHFTFFTEIRHADTGEDLYPRVRELWSRRFFDYSPGTVAVAKALARVPWVDMAVDQYVTPLVAHMVRTYGLLPCSIDSHIGEYVPDAERLSHWHQTPVRLHEGWSRRIERIVTRYGDGRLPLPLHKLGHSAEEPIPILQALWTGEARQINSVNVPNAGYVPNLPEGAIVEVPAVVDGDGVHPEAMPAICEPLAELMRTQIELQDLVVQSALTGDPAPAFEALRRDPLSPPDEVACRRIFDELWRLQAPDLPFTSPPPQPVGV